MVNGNDTTKTNKDADHGSAKGTIIQLTVPALEFQGDAQEHMLVVRLQGVLTAAEQNLVRTVPVEKGRDLLKQVRTQLIEVARPALETLVEGITGVKPLSLHHDISTLTGEEIVIFTLAESPGFREAKTR